MFFTVMALSILVTNAWAVLISTVHTDTPYQLDVTWTWDEVGIRRDEPVLSNWDDRIVLSFLAVVDTDGITGYNGQLSIYLTTPPPSPPIPIPLSGPTQPLPSPFIAYIHLFPFTITEYGVITEYAKNIVEANYHFVFNRAPNPEDSLIQLTATRSVPLPGAILLFGSGLAGLMAIRRRKK